MCLRPSSIFGNYSGTCIRGVLENGHDNTGNGRLDHVEDAVCWRSACSKYVAG